MNWDDVPPSVEEIHHAVDVAYVAARELTVDWTEDADGRVTGLCPLHDDTRPSFAAFGHRVGCWACGWRGDVFDVIQHARSVGFREAFDIIVTEYFGRAPAPTTSRLVEENGDARAALRRTVRAAQRSARWDPSPVTTFLRAKNLALPTEWVLERWRLGVLGEAVVAPHYDLAGDVIGFKVRTAAEPWRAGAGSRLFALYGLWHDVLQRVILCEGETDTWWVDWVMGSSHTALGLPSGASSRRDDWAALLADRDVTLAFDGDPAGRAATAWWAERLPHAHVIHLSDGVDCAMVTDPDDLRRLLT